MIVTGVAMKTSDVDKIRKELKELTERRNESLGSFNDNHIGIGRFVTGSSPWEKHKNGDELLLVTDGEVQIEVLENSSQSWRETLKQGQLFTVPMGKWHQLTAEDDVTIIYISPPDEGAERLTAHPMKKNI